jgi:hypothetical protein
VLEDRTVPSAIRDLPGFRANTLAANDDGSTGLVPIGFNVNYFGLVRDHLFVNNNGNVTFDEALAQFTPDAITAGNSKKIIASFFADVDTRGTGSGLVMYGQDTIDGRHAFGVDYFNVGYFNEHVDKINTFQLILIDASTTGSCGGMGGAGDFDIEFNYQQIQWETGDASGGSNGLGGSSAVVGYTNGTGQAGAFFQVPGSGVNGAFLDSASTGLSHTSLNSGVSGRYLFFARNGGVSTTAPTTTTATTVHYYATGADAGGGPEVKVYNSATGDLTYDFFAFDTTFTGGVRVAVGDVNGDGTQDIICAAGPGGAPEIRVFDGRNSGLMQDFLAYGPGFQGGVFVASADVNMDAKADIITGAGAGGGPHVRVFSGANDQQLFGFFAFDFNFTGGVSVAAGDINGDGRADIVTGAGPGGGPEVRIFSGADASLLQDYFAYDPSFTGGVSVATGTFMIGCTTDVITGAGPGGGPQINVFEGHNGQLLYSFFGGPVNFQFLDDGSSTLSGVRVGATDLNGDGIAEILAAFGPGHNSTVLAFDVPQLNQINSFFATDPSFQGGIFVSGG